MKKRLLKVQVICCLVSATCLLTGGAMFLFVTDDMAVLFLLPGVVVAMFGQTAGLIGRR